jgi:hypothetical protein
MNLFGKRDSIPPPSKICIREVSGSHLGWDIDYPDWCSFVVFLDRLCGLVVKVSGYTSRGPGFDSRRFQIF